MPLTRRALVASALLAPIPARAGAAEAMVLDVRPGSLRLAPAPKPETAVWSINGTVPGPVLRAKQGEEIFIRLINNLNQKMALHWQGLRSGDGSAQAAGFLQEPLSPGEQRELRFTTPDAGTYWYRPSLFPHAAEQKGRGVYGLLIVDGPDDPPVDREFLAVIDDWRLDEDGQIRGPFLDLADVKGAGRIGSELTVNSRALPQVMSAPPGARVRLRILNACSSRLMGLTFENLRPLVVGIDGQACEPFEPARMTLPSGPGSRFDVIFDMPRDAGPDPALSLRDMGLSGDSKNEQGRKLISFRSEGAPAPARGPVRSPPNPNLPPVIKLQSAHRLDLTIEEGKSADPRKAWTFNGVASNGADAPALFRVKRGQPVSLGFINRTRIAHTAHVHGHAMRVLHLLDDGWEPYWRDTVIIPPGATVRVAFQTEWRGKWLIESTILDHAMSGLAAWFEVV
jgi:FtsP/CotA-like multicopper oxidase with cupredoxin domain